MMIFFVCEICLYLMNDSTIQMVIDENIQTQNYEMNKMGKEKKMWKYLKKRKVSYN